MDDRAKTERAKRRKANAEIERQLDQLWGPPDPKGRMSRLCARFPSLARVPGTSPEWDPVLLVEWMVDNAYSDRWGWQGWHAATFVLSVWMPEDWAWFFSASLQGLAKAQLAAGAQSIRFDLVLARREWDAAHTEAFRLWLQTPFWPTELTSPPG